MPVLPVLPLKDTVVYPQIVRPLGVGRRRSLAALNHVVEGARALRGESTSPVDDAEVCLVTSAACVPSSALILGRR